VGDTCVRLPCIDIPQKYLLCPEKQIIEIWRFVPID
jgi:hypothetical protein